MNIDKTLIPTRLLWVDLEMTGLDSNNDLILEIAAEITDFDFKTIANYEAIIKQPHAKVVSLMAKNTWWQNYPDNRDDFLSKISTGKPLADVEQ
jgi:oligoribonuclease